jgi:hypothetical protein
VGVRSSTLNQIASRNTQVVTSRAPNPNTEFNANDMPNDPYQTVPHGTFMEHSEYPLTTSVLLQSHDIQVPSTPPALLI